MSLLLISFVCAYIAQSLQIFYCIIYTPYNATLHLQADKKSRLHRAAGLTNFTNFYEKSFSQIYVAKFM